MLDLKKLLGDKYKEDLKAEELLNLIGELNLGDLSTGDYVSKLKFNEKESENARLNKLVNEYKEKENASLTEAQKQERERQDLLDSYNALKEENTLYKLKEAIMSNGYSKEECEKIIGAQKNGQDPSLIYAEIMKSHIEDAVKAARAEMTKNHTPTPPDGKDLKGLPDDIDDAVKFATALAAENSDKQSQ